MKRNHTVGCSSHNVESTIYNAKYIHQTKRKYLNHYPELAPQRTKKEKIRHAQKKGNL